jgi:hypothetical protein
MRKKMFYAKIMSKLGPLTVYQYFVYDTFIKFVYFSHFCTWWHDEAKPLPRKVFLYVHYKKTVNVTKLGTHNQNIADHWYR